MKLLTGYLAPWQGWRGSPATAYRPIGWQVPPGWLSAENGPLYTDMTPPACSAFCRRRGLAAARKRQRIDAVVEALRVGQRHRQADRKSSRGYRQPSAWQCCCTSLTLILDEPTTAGPQPDSRSAGTIRKLGESKTVLLSTHILQEVEAMANRVLFINEGQLIFDGDQGADQRTAVRWTSISAS